MREVMRALRDLFIRWRKFGLWLSLVERLVRDQEAVGSNPTSPIKRLQLQGQMLRFDSLSTMSPNTYMRFKIAAAIVVILQ